MRQNEDKSGGEPESQLDRLERTLFGAGLMDGQVAYNLSVPAPAELAETEAEEDDQE